MNSNGKLTSLSIFLPCYNDEKSIGKLVRKSFNLAQRLAREYEVIVVDDFSTDKSRKILVALQRRHKKLKLVFHESNLGYGGALKSGFQAANYAFIFYTDGDGQYEIEELEILVNLVAKDADFINGIKMVRHDPTYRIIIGNIYSLVARWAFWLPIQDVDCDFRLISAKIMEKVDLKCKSGAVCIEIVKKCHIAGAKFRQVSVHHLERKHGSSQFFRPQKLIATLLEVTDLWFKLMLLRHKP